MEPRKDYDDYSRFINDTYVEEKTEMLNKTTNFASHRKSHAPTQNYNPLLSLRTYSDLEQRPISMLNRSGATTSKNSRVGLNPLEKKLGASFNDFDVRPKILESRIAQHDDFFNLSDGFKKIFTQDKKDQKMILPIAGYGGHRRGDRSQNFFGKSFRESSLQSKKLQRDLRSPSVTN